MEEELLSERIGKMKAVADTAKGKAMEEIKSLREEIKEKKEKINQLESAPLIQKSTSLESLLEVDPEEFCLVCGFRRIDLDPTGLTCGERKCLLGLSILIRKNLGDIKEVAEQLAIDCKEVKINEMRNEVNSLFSIHGKIKDLIGILNAIADQLGLEVDEDPVKTISAIDEEIKLIVQKIKDFEKTEEKIG